MKSKTRSRQVRREVDDFLREHKSATRRYHATKAVTDDDAWLVVMDALLAGDAVLAASTWNSFYYDHDMMPPPPPERFAKALKSKGRNKIDKAVLDRFKQLAPRYEAVTKRNARVVEGHGMGGYLNPPGHPAHTFHVETDLERRAHNRGSMSLEAAEKDRSIDPTTRKEVQELLERWESTRPSMDTPKVRTWIAEVLRHFGNTDRGVEWVQKFYPEYG